MRAHRSLQAGLLAAALAPFGLICGPGWAQSSSAVPPPKSSVDQSLKSTQEAYGGIKTGLVGAGGIVQGSGYMLEGTAKLGTQQASKAAKGILDNSGSVYKGVDTGMKYLERTDQALTLIRGCADGDRAKCTDTVTELTITEAQNRTMDAGCVATGPFGPACKGGLILRDVIRAVPTRGGNSTFGDTIDNLHWKAYGEPITNYIRTGHTDPLSDAAIQEGMERARQNRRDMMDQIQSGNAAVAQKAADEQAAAEQARLQSANTGTAGFSGSAGDSPLSTMNTVLQQMNTALANQSVSRRQVMAPYASPARTASQGTAGNTGGACVPAQKLDPKTGCHPGHNESSHPGGCKCASGSPSAQVRLP